MLHQTKLFVNYEIVFRAGDNLRSLTLYFRKKNVGIFGGALEERFFSFRAYGFGYGCGYRKPHHCPLAYRRGGWRRGQAHGQFWRFLFCGIPGTHYLFIPEKLIKYWSSRPVFQSPSQNRTCGFPAYGSSVSFHQYSVMRKSYILCAAWAMETVAGICKIPAS
jgi:hypothetical protein